MKLAVAVHDVEPGTLDRCQEIRGWLAERGIGRVTLLVIPARGDRPLHAAGDAAVWLRQRRREGDVVAQHGLRHAQRRRGRFARQRLAEWQGGSAAEFVGLGARATERALARGRGILREAGLEPRGFVAPAYAYTGHLRHELVTSYEWWSDLLAVRAPAGARFSPALCLGSSTAFKRATSPPVVRGLARIRAGRATDGSLLRVDIHPADFDHRRARVALERALLRAERQTAVTYDELV